MRYTGYYFDTVFWVIVKLFWAISFIMALQLPLFAQNDSVLQSLPDTTVRVLQSNDTIYTNDSVYINVGDTLMQNNLPVNEAAGKKSAITSKVVYSATDSIRLDLENQKVYLYREADISYEKIKQKAGYVEIDFNTNILTAKPLIDSTGTEIGLPEFSEGSQSFKSKEMRYNFDTKKGLIKNVITQEGQGYLHGELVKKMDNDVSNMRGGGYTTCNLDHPHFSLKFTKAKVIPNNKIVTGPAYMTIEDVPLPIVLPFGLFPNKRGQTSGILIPTYGESTERGFYLENGGYYFGINEYMELRLIGDIYSRGSWAVKPTFNYRKRYKFSGNLNFNYAINTQGVRETERFQKTRDFKLIWTHRQDPKARPRSQFNASVNFGTRTFSRYNPVSVNDHLTNTYGSSVSYSTSFGERVNMTAALTHSQNTTNKTVNLTLPNISLGVNTFFPFRRPDKVSNLKWYDNISMKYNMNARNEVNTYDTLMFTNAMLKSFENGIQHTIPVNLTLKLLKYFSFSNSVNFNERWYSSSITRTWMDETAIINGDTVTGYVRFDTVPGFYAVHEYNYSSGISTSLYGMVQMKKGPVRAVRHVMRPSVSFSLRPDFGSSRLGYYRTVQTDTTGRVERYSIFRDAIYGTPADGRSGMLNFNITNNLEMKVRSKRDTITGMKKVMLIENFSIGTSYDLAKDSLQWSPLRISVRTTLFKKLQISYSSTFNPYMTDDRGRPINRYEWTGNNRLFRRDNSSWNFSMAYNFSSGQNKTGGSTSSVVVASEEAQEIIENPDEYINWNNPWNFSFSYNLGYNDFIRYPQRNYDHRIVHTIGINGDINVTPKWKVNFSSNYDIENSKLSYAQVSVYRDLHCWEMRFNWIPTGYLKSWNFYIKVKAEVLQDLKLNRKKDFRDNL